MKAIIFDIQRNSYVDGPGLRTTVFFKGCNLKCKWCHNPESQKMEPQMMYYRNLCTNCGKCREVCTKGLENCELCGRCTIFCPADARSVCGREYTVDEVLTVVLRDKSFYETSGGGVTFSGGECMLQLDFLEEILKKCKENGINTAVDTAGNVPWESFERIVPYTDLFLYDIKCYSEELHKAGTGVSNKRIIENLKKLTDVASVTVRIPVIEGFNADEAEMKRIIDFLTEYGCKSAELLLYHKMGENKYSSLGMEFTEYEVPQKEKMNRYKDALSSAIN